MNWSGYRIDRRIDRSIETGVESDRMNRYKTEVEPIELIEMEGKSNWMNWSEQKISQPESIGNRSWVRSIELIGTENQPIKNESEQKICRSKWIDRKREKSVWPNESIDQEKSRSWVRPNESKRDPPKAFLAGLSYFISFATTFLNEKLGFQSLYCTQQRNIRVSVYRVTPVAASCSTHACKLPRLPCVDSVSKRYFYI